MREYAALIAPSTNRVYTKAAPRMTRSEIEVFDAALLEGRVEEIEETAFGGVPYLLLRCGQDGLTDRDLRALANLSGLYALFAVAGDGLLRPLPVDRLDALDDDLLTIQKYSGKTNEQFTRALLNTTALATDAPADFLDRPLRVLDPLAGRGTTLNQALMYGWDAYGVEVDGKDVDAYAAFLRTWLKEKRFKHRAAVDTVRRSKVRLGRRFAAEFAADKERYRSGAVQTAELVHADTLKAGDFFRRRFFDAVVADAPYGVQHGSQARGAGTLSRRPAELLSAAVPVWTALLRPGGALGLSWNVRTCARQELAAILADAGLTVLGGPGYAGFRHRVDQAIERDLIVARKPAA